MDSSEQTYLAEGGATLPEPSDADVGAGAGIGRLVPLVLMAVLITLAFCCLG